MIEHVVLLSLRAEHDPKELQEVMAGLSRLDLPGIVAFTHGPNLDAEGKSPDYPYGFVVRFESRAALDAYAGDATHRALGARLVALCRGGGAGIFVADLAVGV